MSIDNKIWDIAERFQTGAMTEDELLSLQEHLESDASFATAFHECVNLLRSLEGSGGHYRFKAMLHDIHDEQASEAVVTETEKLPRTIALRTYYRRIASIAAGVALLASGFTYWGVRNTDKKNTSEYNLLRRDLENIKRSQNQLIQNFNKENTPAPPPSPVHSTGTGFALTNDGYFVTNAHVTEGADSLYIQDNDGEYYKATVVVLEPNTDIAILKVADKTFRLGKGELPYTFTAAKVGMGARVYTLGFPEDELIYSEGYISARNGYKDDSMQYRLEMPADFGQSGAPVLDANGNIVGIVTAKGSQNEGNTYAVSSKALVSLVHSSLPDVHLPKTNRLSNISREDQVKKMEKYTCSVKVYKK